MLIPNGPYAIVGEPNLPDGLRTVHIDDLTAEEAKQVGLPPRRAGPRRRRGRGGARYRSASAR
jgi:hypothetical protein